MKNDFSIIYRCLHYFNSCEKLQLHEVDLPKNDCAIWLPSEDDKWFEFDNYSNREWVPFIVYADLECVLRKTESDKKDASSYAYQRHEVFSTGYYVRDARTTTHYRRITSVAMKAV